MSFYELQHVCKSYKTSENEAVLDDLSLTLNEGEFISVCGISGVGKSTLLLIMAGLLSIDSGRIEMNGKDIFSAAPARRAAKIGYMFQRAQLIQAFTVKENLHFIKQLYKDSSVSSNMVLETLGLTDKADSLPRHLSGGQLRRAALAALWIRSPRLILLDEPTNDLDEQWTSEIMKLIKQWKKENRTVVLSTHNREFAEQADNIYTLKNGRLIND